MLEKYTLVGSINLFNVVPDFVFPVFEKDGVLYFQEGENNRINSFVEVKESVYSRVIPLKNDLFTKPILHINSLPIYAFQESNNSIIYGNSDHLSHFLSSYRTENAILKKEIQQFFEDISCCPQRKQPIYTPKRPYFYGTGRRKSSVARVRLYQGGTGSIIINGRDIDHYFGLDTLKLIVRQPLITTKTLGTVDIICSVTGGGVSGQAGAIRHGISRALLQVAPEYRVALKAAGFLTRDPRMKERKKYGLKAARRAPQFSKR